MGYKLVDNRARVKARMEVNLEKALHAMGKAGIESIIDMMDNGYEEPIKDTGAMKAEQVYYVDLEGQRVLLGVPGGAVSAQYARFVHEGTVKMEARPFIRDALVGGKEEVMKGVVEGFLKG